MNPVRNYNFGASVNRGGGSNVYMDRIMSPNDGINSSFISATTLPHSLSMRLWTRLFPWLQGLPVCTQLKDRWIIKIDKKQSFGRSPASPLSRLRCWLVLRQTITLESEFYHTVEDKAIWLILKLQFRFPWVFEWDGLAGWYCVVTWSMFLAITLTKTRYWWKYSCFKVDLVLLDT